MSEGGYEATRGGVDMNGNVSSSFGLIFVQYLGYLLDWFVVASVRRTKDNEDSNRVFVDVVLYQVWVESKMGLFADRKNARFDFEVAGVLF